MYSYKFSGARKVSGAIDKRAPGQWGFKDRHSCAQKIYLLHSSSRNICTPIFTNVLINGTLQNLTGSRIRLWNQFVMSSHRIRQVQSAYWACLGWAAAGVFGAVVFGGAGDVGLTVLGAAVEVAFTWSSWLEDFALAVVVAAAARLLPPPAAGVAFALAVVAAVAFPLGLLGSLFVSLKLTLSKLVSCITHVNCYRGLSKKRWFILYSVI